jgi:hypothetical protein
VTPERRAEIETYIADWLAAKQAAIGNGGCPILLAVEVMSLEKALPGISIPSVEARPASTSR